DFSGTFLLVMWRTPETALLCFLRSARPCPAVRVTSVAATSASRLPTGPEYSRDPGIPLIQSRLSEIPPVAKPLPPFGQRLGPRTWPPVFGDRAIPARGSEPTFRLGSVLLRSGSPDAARRVRACGARLHRRNAGAEGAGVEPARLAARP